MILNWILERDMFSDNHERLANAVENAGQKVISWNDEWWDTSKLSQYNDSKVIFHGSLNNASRIQKETKWNPGAYCKTESFECSDYYPGKEAYLANPRWSLTTVSEFVENPQRTLEDINVATHFFVRPNSPLKHFSGRVLSVESLSLEALDYGFYYEEKNLDIIVTPIQEIGDEWRYIVVSGKVIAGSGYNASTRNEIPAKPNESQWLYAQEIASSIEQPEEIYVMDLCLIGAEIKLLELNPFSGADLYACDREAIVKSISELIK